MANYITGNSGTGSSDLSTRATMANAVLIVGVGDESAAKEKILQINGTVDAATIFGSDSLAVEMTKVLIQNGANNIKGIAIGAVGGGGYTDVDAAYAAALKATLIDNTILTVVLDTTATASLNVVLKTHLAEAEENDLYRYGVVGFPIGTDEATAISKAKAFSDKRMFAVSPNVVDDTNTEKDGAITAAGLAALIMTETSDPALPMNSVAIAGYPGTSRVLMRTERNNLANGGVTALYPEDGQPIVWRLVTTYTAEDKLWAEGTTIMIADDVLSSVITRLKANYKRTKNVSRILDAIKTDVIDVLEGKEGMEIINDFDRNSVSVINDPDDKYGALVDYEIQVVTPLYTITIRQHVKV